MDALLAALKAAAEPTRLRLLALCAHAELTVTELTSILSQSQPRVSRHLKLLLDAGLLSRFREGTWAYFRIAERGAPAELARTLIDMIPPDDPHVTLDLERLDAIRRARAEAAASYFRENASRWDEIRSLHVPERDVERALERLFPKEGIADFLDVGTGTGRMLELFSNRVDRGIGVDLSREMLSVARTNLTEAGIRNCVVRQADMYHLPFPAGAFDAVLIHQVLHFADHPAEVLAEAGRVLRPGGRLVVVDFARHDLEPLRSEHAHRRLGFDSDEVVAWLHAAHLAPLPPTVLPGDPLTVLVWAADRPGAAPLVMRGEAPPAIIQHFAPTGDPA